MEFYDSLLQGVRPLYHHFHAIPHTILGVIKRQYGYFHILSPSSNVEKQQREKKVVEFTNYFTYTALSMGFQTMRRQSKCQQKTGVNQSRQMQIVTAFFFTH